MFKAYVEQKRGHGVSLTEAPRMKHQIFSINKNRGGGLVDAVHNKRNGMRVNVFGR